MKLLLTWLLLAAAASGLWFLDRKWAEEELSSRKSVDRIGRLIREAERGRLKIAAVTVETGKGQAYVYAPVEGYWRCVNANAAVASEAQVNALMKALLDAEGVVQSSDAARVKDYGFDGERMLRIQLHGAKYGKDPGRDVLFRIDLGAQVKDLEGCYVRRQESPLVWAIDTDPWSALGIEPGDPRPPLLDPAIVPQAWPGESRRVDSIEVFPEGGPPFEIALVEQQVSEEEMRAGKSPYTWTCRSAGADVAVKSDLAMAFYQFLLKAPWQAVLDAAALQAAGLDPPRARVVLKPAQGQPAELRLGAARPDGLVAVLNSNTRVLLGVGADVAACLAPKLEALLPEATANPWEPFLRQEQPPR